MKVSSNRNVYCDAQAVLHKKKVDADGEIVRRELVRVWTRLLEKYARPGVPIPSVAAIRQELIQKGVDAAVKAVIDEHWFVFDWMIRDEIRGKVERGLDRFDLEKLLRDVKIAQHDPGMLNYLRNEIRNEILFGNFN